MGGAEHLSGNVWKWQLSAYEAYPYVADDGREDYRVIHDFLEIVCRGGSYNDSPFLLRGTDRKGIVPDRGNSNIGFRVVRLSSV